MFLDRAFVFLVSVAFLHRISGYATDSCGGDHLGIIGGNPLPIDYAPYIAALLMDMGDDEYKFICGATIIHEQFLLTAANCVRRTKAKASMGAARYSETNLNTIVEVDSFIPHKDFNFDTWDNDICLVKLKTPIQFSYWISKIILADKDLKIDEGTLLNATGWGRIDPNSEKKAWLLMQTSVPMISNKCCHAGDKLVNDDMFCAGIKGRGVCNGDNGGPLTFNGTQVGIVSRRASSEKNCGDGLDVYTRVGMYRDWIEKNIQENL